MAGHHRGGPGGPLLSPGADADTLSDVLQTVRLSGTLFFLIKASPPWAAGAPASAALAPAILPRAQHVVSYHVITEGVCWCRMPRHAPVRLEAGDVLVIPHGDAYELSSGASRPPALSPDESLIWFRRMAAGQLPLVVEEGDGRAERIRLVCGFLGCDALPFNPLLATLPRLLRIRRPREPNDRLDALIQLATGEVGAARAGSRSVLLRLGELMFVEVMRRHLTAVTRRRAGWLGGLRDPMVARALACLHGRPAHPWTLDVLAREVAASRSVLAERFTQFVGQPPMHYLTGWRMQLAAGKLADPGAKVSAVAREVGYDSEAAFSRAFKKVAGMPPARWRDR